MNAMQDMHIPDATLAVEVSAPGGTERLQRVIRAMPRPSATEVLIRHTAIGLNFIDIYHRTGAYPVAMPVVPGIEGEGVVLAVGERVADVRPGDRVAYAGPMGAYAEYRTLAADKCVPVPDALQDGQAAAVLMKGLTADALMASARLAPGQTCLVWAAAGAVGSVLTQMASARGVRVIGVVGGAHKVEQALRNGCVDVIDRSAVDVAQAVRRLTDGALAHAVFDGIGKDSIATSIQCVAKRGTLVSYGNASGAPPLVDLIALGRAGSIYATRMVVFDFIADRPALLARAARVFAAVADGTVRAACEQRFALHDVALAHECLESGRTTGSIVLMPAPTPASG